MSPERRDLFPDLLAVLHPNPHDKIKPVALLQVYMDESGHSSRQKYVAVAGFMGPADQWIGFYDEWNAVLAAAGVVQKDGLLGAFHMADYEGRHGLYKEWDQPKRIAVMGRLMEIITTRQLYAVGFIVEVDWWRSVDWQGEAPEHDPLEDPYHYAIQKALAMTVMIASHPDARSLNGHDGIAAIFAQQSEYGGAGLAYLTVLGKILSTKNFLVSATYGGMLKYPQLQAADILAFELRWRFTRPDIDRWTMRQILNTQRGCFGAVPIDQPGVQTLGGERKPTDYSDLLLRVKRSVIKESRRKANNGRRKKP